MPTATAKRPVKKQAHPSKTRREQVHRPLAREVILGLLDSFPKASTKTLARRAYRDSPELWKDLETCRSAFRYYRGQMGKTARKRLVDKSRIRVAESSAGFPKMTPKIHPRVLFSDMPEGRKQMPGWGPLQVDTEGWWMVVSDLHIPFHDHEAIRAIWAEAKRRKIAGILLNGDFMDCFSISHWERDPRMRDFPGEIKTTKEFLESQQRHFPKARKIWKHGNHEEWFDQYMQTKAPELLNVAEFDLAVLTGAKNLGVETVREKRPVKLGKLWALHGHEYKFPISNPVNPARGLYNRAKVSAIAGHLHQSSAHTEAGLDQHIVTCWSTGCLCDMRPKYGPLSKWNLGAAFVEVSRDGAFQVDNYRFMDGKLWR